ncbi:MAG: hypothetical protein H6555_02720 [Lewinellaceae bacterium]|nr:hypothetical protein [Lewinellaceae bacterium]
MKIILLLTAIILIAVYFYFNPGSSKSTSTDIPYGPFTVRVTATTGKTFNMNYGRVNYTNVAYAILYKGQPVVFPDALQNNTGLPFMWAVYALPGAPDPTLIAGSQSLFLVYLQKGEPIVKPILKQGYDFASLQFLDSEEGQPGPYSEVFMKNETAHLDTLDRLEGGRFLMVSEHAILDVQTRKIWEMNKNNNDVENYSFPSPHGALAFSPDQKSIVFHAEFQSWNTPDENLPDSEHALVVYNFEKDSGYAVKYDDTDTRMTNTAQDVNRTWFSTYFAWNKSPEGDQLHLRELDQLPYWKGKYTPNDHYYTLYPVKPEMLPVFLDFVFGQMGWSKANILEEKTHEYTGHCLLLGSGEVKFDIRFKEDEQILTFSSYSYEEMTPEKVVRVKKIADAFNAELSSGKHQAYFGRIFSATKRIRGVD